MAEQTPDPATPSTDYQYMVDYWTTVNDINCGAPAMRGAKFGGPVNGPAQPYSQLSMFNKYTSHLNDSPYLPRFPGETPDDYEYRRCHAPFTPIFSDATRYLASMPFTHACGLADDAPADLRGYEDNIDGQGNAINIFAYATFKGGIDKGVQYILVDYTNVPGGATLAAEKEMGARPYFVNIPAEKLIAGYSAFVNGQEVIYHVRICEDGYIADPMGYGETAVTRVREFSRLPQYDPQNGRLVGYSAAYWQLWEQQETVNEATNQKEVNWVVIDSGVVSIGIIPLVRFYTGPHQGWRVEAPFKDLAHMQIDLFQQDSNLKCVREQTAFPMLAANGIDLGENTQVKVGPKAVLGAPPGTDGKSGEWKSLEPQGTSLEFLAKEKERLETRMRDLSMQPLNVANQTIVNTANLSIKAHSQIQAWALMLKDAFEQAFHIMSIWVGRPNEYPEFKIFTDFGVTMTSQVEIPALLQANAQRVISVETTQEELQRRGVLSADFDPAAEQEKIASDMETLLPDQPINPRTGQLLQQTSSAAQSNATQSAVNAQRRAR